MRKFHWKSFLFWGLDTGFFPSILVFIVVVFLTLNGCYLKADAAEFEPTLVVADALPEDGEDGGVEEDELRQQADALMQIEPYSTFGTQIGAIPTDIYNYFRDTAATLPFGTKYVFYRETWDVYILAYSDDLAENGGSFFSKSVNIIRYNNNQNWNENNPGITRYTDNNFRVSAGRANVYSNLGIYPRLFEGVTRYEFQALLVVTVISFLSSFVLRFFR